MGSIVYDFLSESMFLHEETIANKFRNETSIRIEKELDDYRQFWINNFETITEEINSTQSSLKSFSSLQIVPTRLLTQTALYFDQFIISDPLFSLTEHPNELSKISTKSLGFQEPKIDKAKLSEVGQYLKNITPFVIGDYVKLFPTSYFFERRNIPLLTPNHYFNEIMPDQTLSFFRSKVIVNPLTKTEDKGWIIKKSEKLKPCRAISIEFDETEMRGGMIYFLTQSRITDTDQDGHKIFLFEDADTLPDIQHFDFWVEQSIRSASKNYFDTVFQENEIAASLNANYLTDNTFTADLLNSQIDEHKNIESFTANQILNIEVPFLDSISVDQLMNVRINEADLFTSFRTELEKSFRELRTTSDTSQFKIKAENIFHELNNVQGQKIKRKFDHLKSQMYLNAGIAIAGLGVSLANTSITLLAAIIAAAKGFKDYQDYREKVIENPSYFLWKVKKSTK